MHPEFVKLGEWVKNEREGAERDALAKIRSGDVEGARTKAGHAYAMERLANRLQDLWDEARDAS